MPNLGSIETASGGTASWFESATTAFVNESLATSNWTLTGWFKLRDASSTAALIEYASSSTVSNVTTMMALGLYRLGNGKLRVQHDRSAASLGYFHDFDVTIGSAPFFLGLVKTLANPSQGTITQQYALTLDDDLREEGSGRGRGWSPVAATLL